MDNLYLHFPFCQQKCHYCHFFSQAPQNFADYFSALQQEIKGRAPLHPSPLQSIYLGGGSPALAGPSDWQKIIDLLVARFGISPSCEISLELNPQQVSEKNFQAWEKIGINRFSIGIQTWQTKWQDFLGRQLNYDLENLAFLKNSNLNYNFDLIFGFPGQNLDDIEFDLQKSLAFNPPHLSYYVLDHHGSRLKKWRRDFPLLEKMQNSISKKLSDYEHYEIFSFAQRGKQCRHHLDFWQGKNYLGFGASAVSKIDNQIIKNSKNLDYYLKSPLRAHRNYYLPETEQKYYHLLSALRLLQPVDLKLFFSDLEVNNLIIKARNFPDYLEVENSKMQLKPLANLYLNPVINALLA